MKKFTLILIGFLLLSNACSDVFETDISDEKLHVIAPVDGACLSEEGEVTFLWEHLESAVRYRFTVVSPSFEQAVKAVEDIIILPDSAAVNVKHKVVIGEGDYQWSLKAINGSSSTRNHIFDLSVEIPGNQFDP